MARKLRLHDYFTTYGWLLPIFFLVSLVAWYWPITSVNAFKPEETINIFAECYKFKDEELVDDLYEAFGSYGVENVSLNPYSPDDENINSYYTAFGVEADILLLTSSTVDNNLHDVEEILKDWIPFDDELIGELGIPEGAEYFEAGEQAYALKVFDAFDEAYPIDFSPFGSFEKEGLGEDVYMLLRSASPNFGSYSDEGKTENGLRTVRFLLERYDEDGK